MPADAAAAPQIRITATLDAARAAAVAAVIESASSADGRSPVSEHTVLHLRNPALDTLVRHVLAESGGRIVGYGAVLPGQGGQPPTAEVAVDPQLRNRGVGHAIVAAQLSLAGAAGLALWTHGRAAPLGALARSMGFERRRTLLQMRRSLADPLPRRDLPAGFVVRSFRRGTDDEALLAVNAAAFVDLPDQAGWSAADLRARVAEPWFDPAGLLLMEDAAGTLAGFHWTKLHSDEPVGEIYVLAVAPAFAGRGLAAPMALIGLQHLCRKGATTAMLYVDEANRRAVRLYEGLGFAVHDVDVLYAHGA